jgi:hypothetical protein
MSCPGGRCLLFLLLLAAALAGCSTSASSEKPSAGSDPRVSPGFASTDSGSPTVPGPSTGTVTGRVLFVGGPAPGLPRAPKNGGTVVFTGTPPAQAQVDTHGRFSVQLTPGNYRVRATSPDYINGHGVCEARQPVHVTDGGHASVTVYCQID